MDDSDRQHNVILRDTEPSDQTKPYDEDLENSISIPSAVIKDRIEVEVDEFRPQLTSESTWIDTTKSTDMRNNKDVTDENLDMTDNNMDVRSNDNALSNDPDMSNEKSCEETDQNKKRQAAVRALEKIREWTRDLMTTLQKSSSWGVS